MAGIDKTYVNSQEWEDGRQWLEKQDHIMINNLGLYEKDSGVLWNTSSDQDVYLAQKCDLDFVQERLKSQYSEEFIGFRKDIDIDEESFIFNIKFDKSDIYLFERIDDKDIELYDNIVIYGNTNLLEILAKAFSIFDAKIYNGYKDLEIHFEMYGLPLIYANGIICDKEGNEVNTPWKIVNFHEPIIIQSFDVKDLKDRKLGEIFVSEKDIYSLYDYKNDKGLSSEILLKRSLGDWLKKYIKWN